MANVISLLASKGGTGKTTTALNLSVALAEKGRAALLVDLDPQGAVGLALAKGDTEWAGLAEYLAGAEPLAEVIVQTSIPSLAILPRGRLDPVDAGRYEAYLGGSGKLEELVAAVRPERDFVIIDCPSGLGSITRAALAVSDFALVPLQVEPLALRSFGQVLRVIDEVQRHGNPQLRLLGVLPTMLQLRQETALNVMGTVWAEFEGVLETSIPRADVYARASELGVPVSFLAGRTSPEARRFDLLAAEIESIIEDVTGTRGEAHEEVVRQLV